MAGEFAEFFQELLFGVESGGAWIGLGLIISMAFLVTWKVKYAGIFWAIILVFLSVEYAERISVSNNFMWSIAISLLATPFLIWKVITDVR